MAVKELPYPESLKAIWRAIRAGLAVAFAQIVVLRPDFSNPEEAVRTLSVSFVSGFVTGLFKYLRDKEIVPERLPL